MFFRRTFTTFPFDPPKFGLVQYQKHLLLDAHFPDKCESRSNSCLCPSFPPHFKI
jgi:hypothetical protein